MTDSTKTSAAATAVSRLHAQAIEKALHQDWKEAIRINLEIIKTEENNIDSLNRLAFAYFKIGDDSRAKRAYQKVLKLDGYNQIAIKNLKKLASKRKAGQPEAVGELSPLMFLEEPGKTKIVPLVNIAPERTLAGLTTGQEVFLKEKRHAVEVRDHQNAYLGALPDDLSFKLTKFIAGGNKYHVAIKSIGKNQLIVFIRELSRSKRFANQPSFVSSILLPTSHVESGEAGPDTTPTGEESDEEEETPTLS